VRVLVTGGAGFLGSHLVDALVRRGDHVTVLDSLRRGTPANLNGAVGAGSATVLTDDIRDYGSVIRAVDGAELVFHLAAQSNVMGAIEDPEYSLTTNVLGTYNVLKAAAAAGVRRVVFSSSREVYGEPERLPVSESSPLAPKSFYGASKVSGEAYCRAWRGAAGLECQILRFANAYGPRDRDRVIPLWVERAAAGEPLLIYGGEQILDFVWVGRCVSALLAAATCPQDGPINVGSGQGTPLPTLARRIIDLAGSRSTTQLLPARDVEVVRFVADVSKMRDVLGVQPQTDPLSGLSALVAPGRRSGADFVSEHGPQRGRSAL
jgi:UDP-glucose 4-epimerase